jgi:DNA-directed RNA polymerase I and III subunit RPAC2
MSVNEVKVKEAEFEFEVRGTGNPASRTFAIGNEDHTIGNSLRHVLLQNANVDFAGYSVPHPSEPVVHIRVQTSQRSQMSAIHALKDSCQTLFEQCEIVLEKIEEVMPETNIDRLEIEKITAAEAFADQDMEQDDYDEGAEELYEE